MTCSYAVHFPLEVNVYTSSRPWVAAVGITEVRRSPLALETLLGFRYLSPHLPPPPLSHTPAGGAGRCVSTATFFFVRCTVKLP